MVLTGDSDFFVFELKGVVLLDGMNSLFHPRVYYQKKIMDHFKVCREQLYYFVALRGNDFINASRNTLKIDDETKMSPAKTLEYVKTHFTQAVTTTEKYKRVKWYYCTKHIEDPWSTLTYKKSEVTAIMKWLDSGSTVSSLFFCLETLNKASSSTKIYYQQYARDIVFSPLITIPFVDTVNYLDQCSCE